MPSELDLEAAAGFIVCYCLSDYLLRGNQVTIKMTLVFTVWLKVTSKFSVRQDALSIWSEKTTLHRFFPDGENFPVNP